MYCVLLAGAPATGKSTMARFLARELGLPMASKDEIKELLYDGIGFASREEKVRLGVTAAQILRYFAEQMLRRGQPFLLENNFESVGREELAALLQEYQCTAITVLLTCESHVLYERFCQRNAGPGRHRGHVVNDCYPEKQPGHLAPLPDYEDFINGITARGMLDFQVNGPRVKVDTTDFAKLDLRQVVSQIRQYAQEEPI